MKKIAIVGSINTDMVFETDRAPVCGETVSGKSFSFAFGGKGANEAVAVARLGAKAVLFGAVGDDVFSAENIKNLKREKVDVQNVQTITNCYGGVAGITLTSGKNSIVVASGANAKYTASMLAKSKDELIKCEALGVQAEIDVKVIEKAIDIMHKAGKIVVFNPSPMQNFDAKLYEQSTYIVVNEIEISGMPDFVSVENELKKYPNKLILTQGDKGAYYFDGEKICNVPAVKIKKVVDTTGAGDTFLGAFLVAVSGGKNIKEAIEFACKCASLKCAKLGAQSGMPTKEMVSQN